MKNHNTKAMIAKQKAAKQKKEHTTQTKTLNFISKLNVQCNTMKS